MENEIKVKHPNGYSGILYGKRSMVIFYNNKEVLHTGFRNINTKEELYQNLDEDTYTIRQELKKYWKGLCRR